MVIIWSRPAREDLRLIHQYIAHDSKRYATRVVQDLVDKTEGLLELPRMGRIVPEIAEEDVREISLYSYRIMHERIGDTSNQKICNANFKRGLPARPTQNGFTANLNHNDRGNALDRLRNLVESINKHNYASASRQQDQAKTKQECRGGFGDGIDVGNPGLLLTARIISITYNCVSII